MWKHKARNDQNHTTQHEGVPLSLFYPPPLPHRDATQTHANTHLVPVAAILDTLLFLVPALGPVGHLKELPVGFGISRPRLHGQQGRGVCVGGGGPGREGQGREGKHVWTDHEYKYNEHDMKFKERKGHAHDMQGQEEDNCNDMQGKDREGVDKKSRKGKA